ncbi:hypothetical protein BgiBS90_024472, partial [Biomphalaria glabrata]
ITEYLIALKGYIERCVLNIPRVVNLIQIVVCLSSKQTGRTRYDPVPALEDWTDNYVVEAEYKHALSLVLRPPPGTRI